MLPMGRSGKSDTVSSENMSIIQLWMAPNEIKDFL